MDQPYRDQGLNKIYNLLFCDKIEPYRTANETSGYPWDVLMADKPEIAALNTIAMDRDLESRQRLLACHLLMQQNQTPDNQELMGVIVEVALPEGLDVLAAFSDGTARYINHSEKILVWETPTNESEQLIIELFNESVAVVNQIGPWEGERKPAPGTDMIRLSFLVSDGLYFGEGPFEVLQDDPMGGPVIQAATNLMAYLTSTQS
ncbi:MAG TPA: hypothetical protein VM187_13285 [Niastella sp.]|nr:hypothetical protein [Niastella sp.]